jgi:HlyD family secretion protein
MDVQRPDAKKRRRQRLLALAVGGAAFLFLLIVGLSFANRPPAISGDDIWSDVVTRGELVHEITAVGTLIAPELRAVTNRSAGVVERIRLLPGHDVKADDVLFDMSSPQLEEDLANARWDLDAAEAEEQLIAVELENRYLDIVAQVAVAEAEYTSARLEMEAQEGLAGEQISSAIEVQRARLRAEQWLKRLEAENVRLDRFAEYRAAQEAATQARMSQFREQVARLEARVEDLKVSAGVAGVVQEINVEEGERLEAGTAVARIVNPWNLIARVNVTERDAALVQNGLPVRLEMGRVTLTGHVTRIDPTVRNRSVTVDVALPKDPPAGLRPDLSVTARIELGRVEGTLVLDRPVGLSDTATTIDLYRLDDDLAERVSVELGRVSARQVEILRGLDAGDRVILTDLSEWDGEPTLRIR